MPGPRFQDARALAVGGAYLPLGEDTASALFNNPADVGKFKSPRFEPLTLQLAGDLGYFSTLTASTSGTNALNFLNLSSSATEMNANPGSYIGAGASAMIGYGMKYLAVGLLYQTGFAGVSNGSTITYRSQYQLIPTASAGIRLASGIVRLGYNLQWVNQATTPAGGNTVSATNPAISYTSGLAQGGALAHSAGASMTLPISMLPSLNLVVRNIFGTTYSMPSLLPFTSSPAGAPATEPMSIDASFSLQPKLGSGTYLNYVFEYRDITNVSGVAFLGRVALGLELSLASRFFIRGGWSMNYPAFGLGFRRGSGDFSLTYYNEEFGTQYNSAREPRILMQYQVRAF